LFTKHKSGTHIYRDFGKHSLSVASPATPFAKTAAMHFSAVKKSLSR